MEKTCENCVYEYICDWTPAAGKNAVRTGKVKERKAMDNLIIDCFAGGGRASVGIEMALGRRWILP